MKDNKKKMIVILALGLVIVGVGVFQFISGGSSAAPPAGAGKRDQKKALAAAPLVEPPKNPVFAVNLPARDPFEQKAILTPAQPDPQAVQPKAPVQPRQEPRQMSLPPAEIGKTGSFGNQPLTVQVDPEAKFAFTVSGVMLGSKPMAVFTDAQGGQRLVMVGGSLDPESKVVSIEKDAVTVRFHGKTLRLTVEGKPNAK